MRFVAFLFAAAVLVGCTPSEEGPAEPAPSDTLAAAPDTMATAQAEIAGLDGSGVSGVVTLTEQAGETVLVTYNVDGLAPGLHGFHVHENGDCGPGDDGTPGGAAGGHFAPGGSPHGAPTNIAAERHMGDLGNIEADSAGTASGSFTDDVLAIDQVVGRAMMIHAEADDLTSQPSGAAGARVGCGVIEMATSNAM